MNAGELVQCRACPEMMRVAVMPSGKMNPLDTGEIPLEQVLEGVTGIVAYSPRNGHGKSVTKALLTLEDAREILEGWMAVGVTFHLSHFATCPERKRFKRA